MQRRRFIGVAVGTGTLVGGPLSVSRADEKPVRLAIIVGRNSALRELAVYELRRLYLGEVIRAPGGKKLVPLSQALRSRDRVGFDKSVLGMTPEEVSRYWIERRIRGGSRPPKTVDSVLLLQRVVARLPGAIGYVRVEDMSSEVRALRIDGLTPRDERYPVVY